MQVISVNRGTAIRLGKLLTGICKTSVKGPIQVTKLGIADDAVCDEKFHGGVDQAVYVYGGDDYQYWLDEHGLDLAPGTFGDNLTISHISSLTVSVGDRFEIGEVLLEATAPRIPCATLGQRMQDPKFPVVFRRSQRSGFYCRVLNEGTLTAETAVRYIANTLAEPLSIVDMFELYYNASASKEILEQAVQAPIAIRDRERFLERLAKLNA